MDRPSVLRLTPILFAIVFWVCSCSDNAGTTSGRSARIDYVAWPQKYYGDNSTATQIPLWVEVAWTGTDTTSDWLWVDVSYRVDVEDEVPVAYDTLILGLKAAEQVPCTLKFSPTGGMLQRGFYRLRVGLCNDSDEVTRWDYAYDRASYNLYSGNDKFYLDVDVEYVAQNGMDFLKRNETRIGYIGHPYRHYPLGFIWYLQETEVSVEPILLSPSFFLDYKNRVASHWPSSPNSKKYHYLVVAAEYGTNCDTCAPSLDLLGISSNDYEVSFVFVNAIASSFNEQYLDRVQDYAVSHELGHIIGRGLSDLCREPELHDPSSDTYCIVL